MNESYKNYLIHYGVKRKSGRYPYGSGDRPYQHAEKFDPYQAMNSIDKSLSKKEQNLLGVGNSTNVPVEKFFFDKDLQAYLIATDYHGKHKDEHPIPGKVLGIAAKKNARGTGITDKLISDAKAFYPNDTLVAEIDKENEASRKLFERNGFNKKYDDGYIDYYVYNQNESSYLDRVVKKNSTIYRAEEHGDKRFLNRPYTYVNITDDYSNHSINTSEGFSRNFSYDYVMKAKNDLKIASSEAFFNALMKSNKLDSNLYLKDVNDKIVQKGKYAVENTLPHNLREGEGGKNAFVNNAINELKKMGYDGVVDPIDGAGQQKRGEEAIATILFDPKKNLDIVDIYDLDNMKYY